MRHVFYGLSGLILATIALLACVWPPILWSLALVLPLIGLGVFDALQRTRTVLRNFPVIGRLRYLLEMIRPEINQYFIESNTDGKPFSRELRSIVYQRAKRTLDTLPFGTQRDVTAPGYEWLNHSMTPRAPEETEPRVRIGGDRCARPYDASHYNISAMSFGSLSSAAIRALNGGARAGNFYHNTGEGGISPHHLACGGDLVWQIGTGYFGCRTREGAFSAGAFVERASLDQVKMIEVKLSQGAKPGHGGILPAAKLTPEIAAIRGVPLGRDVISPPCHTAFASPRGLLEFVEELRELSGGKPVGFKLCLGHRAEFLGVCKAMLLTGLLPDYIAIDGGEGGTGAAPLEFSNSIGTPLLDGLVFAHSALVGFGLRERIKLVASGKVITGFHIAQRLAAGADLCASARGFMFSLGCIQALRCNTNECPVGVATQNPRLVKGLDVPNKTERVRNFHAATIAAFLETLAATGLRDPADLRPWHVHRRISHTEVRTYAEIYDYVEPGALLADEVPTAWARSMCLASPHSFRPEVYDEVVPAGGVAMLV
jgi:glutamate synthase domain-containing protein 2